MTLIKSHDPEVARPVKVWPLWQILVGALVGAIVASVALALVGHPGGISVVVVAITVCTIAQVMRQRRT